MFLPISATASGYILLGPHVTGDTAECEKRWRCPWCPWAESPSLPTSAIIVISCSGGIRNFGGPDHAIGILPPNAKLHFNLLLELRISGSTATIPSLLFMSCIAPPGFHFCLSPVYISGWISSLGNLPRGQLSSLKALCTIPNPQSGLISIA